LQSSSAPYGTLKSLAIKEKTDLKKMEFDRPLMNGVDRADIAALSAQQTA